MSPGRGWTQTCLTFWPARSRMVSRICCSVSMSFQTQSGPVLYSRGGFLKSALTLAEPTSASGAARAAAPQSNGSNNNAVSKYVRRVFMAAKCRDAAPQSRREASAFMKPRNRYLLSGILETANWHGVAMGLRRGCDGVDPLGIPCTSLIYPLYNPCTSLLVQCGLRRPCEVSTEPRPAFDSIGLAAIQMKPHFPMNQMRRHPAARPRSHRRPPYPLHFHCR